MKRTIATIALSMALVSCAEKQTAQAPSVDTRKQAKTMQKLDIDVTTSRDFGEKYQSFDAYWFRGKAELNRFELSQSRYGELHEGEAVMIFVTEPFDLGDQVKYEGIGDKSDVTQVLKLNNYRRFYTGVYPYTIMTSTFSPTDGEPMPKVSHSVQEWCGQVFSQLNLKDDQTGYEGMSYSYFQSEGDQKLDVPMTLLEDELYTKVRLGPQELPTGDIELVPSFNYLRLMHKKLEVVAAKASLSEPGTSEYSDRPTRTYKVDYPSHDRTLKIIFEADFPYRVVGFEDSRQALFNPSGGAPETLTTKGKLSRSIMLDYWTKHGNEDAVWRQALGLEW